MDSNALPEDQLTALATRLRQEGAIYGPEMNLMLACAQAIRDLRATLPTEGTAASTEGVGA
jgi:hypothetical protein